MKIFTLTLSLFFASLSYAIAAPEMCKRELSTVTVQLDVKFRFQNPKFNSEEFLRNLSPRIFGGKKKNFGDWFSPKSHDGSWTPISTAFNDAMTARFCVNLGSSISLDLASPAKDKALRIVSRGILDRIDIPKELAFRYGPKSVDFEIPELQSKLSALVSADSYLEASAKKMSVSEDKITIAKGEIIVVENPIEIEIASDPDWLTVQNAKLSRLSDGTAALHLKVYNYSEKTARGAQANITAFMRLRQLCGGNLPTKHELVEFREVDQNSLTKMQATKFQEHEKIPVEINDAPCLGRLNAKLQTVNLSSIPGEKSKRITYQFGTIFTEAHRERAFWSIFGVGKLEFLGNVWPSSIGF